jgi:2-polyprenyl-3-methyl-5-hydroxy-6-metoxy-1,4-benzoquinol methylase
MASCPICKNKAVLFHIMYIYTYYYCGYCKTLFLYPRPLSNKLTEYYQKNFSFQNGLINEDKIRKKAKSTLKQLRNLKSDGKTLLDIGSGYGFFLDEAQKTGLTPTGLEPSKKLHNYSKKFDHLNNRIISIGQSLDQYYKNNTNKKFDFVTVIHVIEHLDDPILLVHKALSLLKKNGILYIETPNLNSHLFLTEKKNYTFLTPPDHLWVFSKKSFYKILGNFKQLIVLKTSTHSYPEHLMGIIKSRINRKTDDSSDFSVPYLNLSEKLKIIFFDKLLARIMTPILNLGGYGSILELYIKKIH